MRRANYLNIHIIVSQISRSAPQETKIAKEI